MIDLQTTLTQRRRLGAPLALALAACAVLGAGCDEDTVEPPPPGPRFEVADFPAPSACQPCHPQHHAEWSTSMHAYAFQDPLFFELNFAEQERTGGALGQFCIECHSPVGPLTGTTTDFFDPETMPEVVRAGVSCVICHFQKSASPGATEAGTPLDLHPGDTMFGPLPGSSNAFHESEQNLVFENSSICRSCHNLTMNGIEMERTFDEWENSIYASRGDSHCQDCHMPTYAGQAAVGGPQREVHRHMFVGVDVALTDFPGRVETRALVEELLQESATFALVTDAQVAAGDTLEVEARITNDKTGHALPSGTTFSRQMWIELTVRDGAGAVLYVTGDVDANGDLRDEHSELDPDGDPDLVLFTSELEGGDHVTVFTATGIRSNLIGTNATHTSTYHVPVPAGTSGPLSVDARLRFRAFPPYKARGAGRNDLAAQLETLIYDMESDSKQVLVQ